MKKLLFLIVAVAGISIAGANAQTTDKKNAQPTTVQVNLNEDAVKTRSNNSPDATVTPTQENRTVDKNSAPASGTPKSESVLREENKVIIKNESISRTQPVKTVDKTTDKPK